MKKILVLLLLLIPSLIQAQGPVSTANRFSWDEQAPDLNTANSYTYLYYIDGLPTGVVLTGAKCFASLVPDPLTFNCTVNLPPFSPGSHTVQISATLSGVESAKSNAVSFTFAIVPGIPFNFRIK